MDSETKTPHAVLPAGDHHDILSLESRKFKRWLGNEYHLLYGRSPYSQAIADARLILEADPEQNEYALHNRVACLDGALWYDLCDPAWRVIRVTGDGWTVEDRPPILFRRYAHQQPQILPERDGQVKHKGSIEDPEDLKLFPSLSRELR